MPNENSILLVEESKVFLTLYRQFLRTTPAEIREARSAAEALTMCQTVKPNLIYMSYDLPDTNGAECCRQIKMNVQLKSVPVIMICDRNDSRQQALSLEADCNGVVTKPIDRIRFLDVGRRFLFGIREIRRACRVIVHCVREGRRLSTRGLDICSGGIFLEGCEDLALNTPLKLEIILDPASSNHISCAGEVAWVNRREYPMKPSHPIGVGVRFTEMTANTSGMLADYLETLNFRPVRNESG